MESDCEIIDGPKVSELDISNVRSLDDEQELNVPTCDDLLHTNVEQKVNLEKVTTWFAHMSSQTRNWSSILRTKDSCKLKNGNENATKNREGLGHLKFDIWRLKRKKIDDTNYKFKHGKIKFDVWKWP